MHTALTHLTRLTSPTPMASGTRIFRMFFYGLVFIAFWHVPAFSGAQSLIFRNISTVQGLPSSEVYNTLQDSRGFMWFATDRGIAKYDGYNFRHISSAEGLPDNTIFKMMEDARARLWFISYSSRIGYIRNDTVYHYKYEDLVKSIIPFQIISNLYANEKDEMWVDVDYDNRYLLFHINPEGKADSSYCVKDENVKKVYVSKTGECLVSGSKSAHDIIFLSLETGEILATFHSAHPSANCIAAYTKTRLGVWLYIDNQLMHVVHKTAVKQHEYQNNVLSFYIDTAGYAWAGYYNHGAEMLDLANVSAAPISLLKSFSVSSIAADNQGGLWLTTLEKGAFYLPPAAPVSYTEADGLTSPRVMRVENAGGNVVLILSNNDIAVKRRGERTFRIYKNVANNTLNIKYISPGIIYFTGGPHLNLPLAGRKIYLPRVEKILPGKKYIWGLAYQNLHQFNRAGKLLRNISFENISRIKCGLELKDESLLIGTLDGLYMYKNNRIRALSGQNEIWSKRISDICQADSTHLAIATIGYGVLLVNHLDFAHPVCLSTKDGLPSIMCQTLYPQNDSVLWIGTNSGLCRASYILQAGRRNFVNFNIQKGIASNEINDINLIADKLWVGTMNGVSLLPLQTPDLRHIIPLYISKVTAGGKTVSAGSAGDLAYKNNHISFFFTAIGYQYPGQLLYHYKLDPLDTVWNTTANRSVIFNSLAPGHYTFSIYATSPDSGIFSHQASFSFVVSPPYWQSWWFILLVIVCIFASVNFFVRFRIRSVKKQERIHAELNNSKEMALRASMKPHFIYNSLNSIQNYILKNETTHSISFLSKFSRLMRLTFNNNDQSLVLLADDLEALRLYAELENLRFEKKFDFSVEISESLDPEKTWIPPLVIQPFVENAIIHGLLPKEEVGFVILKITAYESRICIQIEDNGIGRLEAGLIKEKKQKYRSGPGAIIKEERTSGITLTKERIYRAWAKAGEKESYLEAKSSFKLIDLYTDYPKPAGTRIEFYLPLT